MESEVHCGQDHKIEDAPFHGDFCLTAMAVELEIISQRLEIPWGDFPSRGDLLPQATRIFSSDFFKGLQEIARLELESV